MAFFSDDELGSLQVTRMILHVIDRAHEELALQPELALQQADFFRERIIAEARDAVHEFCAVSDVRTTVEHMASEEMTFEAGGQRLAQQFWRQHVRTAVPGAFFVIELRCREADVAFYALMKYDYRQAVELSQEDGQSVLRSIVHAFVKERKAIQKFCLIRVNNGLAEGTVCASDRMKEAPDLTDYFESFLSVRRSRSNTELSKNLNEVIRSAVEDLKEYVPDREVGLAIAVVKQALLARASVSSEAVLEAIKAAANHPEDEVIQARISEVVSRKLRQKKLDDVDFRPDRAVLRIRPRRYVMTSEDVRIEFPDEEYGQSVIRRDEDGSTVFTIRTARVTQDGTLKDTAR